MSRSAVLKIVMVVAILAALVVGLNMMRGKKGTVDLPAGGA